MQLTKIKTIRFSEDDNKLMGELKRLKVNPDKFIRIAFREKLQREMKLILQKEQRDKNKITLPF